MAAAGTYAQMAPEILPYLYGQKVSPDGKWIVGEDAGGSIVIYDRTTGHEEAGVFESVYYGNGNTFALDGTCVGSTWGDEGVIFKDGEMVWVESLEDVEFCGLNGITADAKRICGLISNPVESGDVAMFVPIYIDLGEDGEYGEPHYLPYPDKDFTGSVPQYASATWISNDGKTILGQVVDASGMFIYPIVYKENESGEWSYTLPSESLWNPNGIELPENPGEFEMDRPDPYSYMTPEEVAEYQDAYQDWVNSGYNPDLYPTPEDFMSDEAKAEYDAYYEEYQAAAKIYDAKISAYLEARAQMYDESTPFLQNGMAMNADGTVFAAASDHTVFVEGSFWPVSVYETYVFDINAGTFTRIESQYTDIVPNQVLAKGEIIGSTPANGMAIMPPLSYVFTPGASDYVPFETYLETTNPEGAEWMKENLMAEIPVSYDPETFEEFYESVLVTGHISASDDFSVVAGGIFSYVLPNEEYAEMGYLTYVFENLKGSSVNSVVADNSSVKALRGGVLVISNTVSDLAVYDLSGRKLFNAASAKGSVNTSLKSGIYVVAYTDMEGNKVAKKVNF